MSTVTLILIVGSPLLILFFGVIIRDWYKNNNH